MILPDMPDRVAKLPKDHRGFPVPWFVAYIDGVPDFRVIGERKIIDAHRHKKCWICGEKLGKFMAFVIGPMCAINRVSSEPPSHKDCAEFAAKACPFLTRPKMKRNTKDLPEEGKCPAGIHLERNPGVTLVWITKDYKPFKAGEGVLFQVGKPEEVIWYAEGRDATHDEVMESIESGYPNLERYAYEDGEVAVQQLKMMKAAALCLVPPQKIEISVNGKDEAFSHVDLTTGELHTFAVTAMNKFASEYDVSGIKRATIPITKNHYDHIMENSGIEEPRVERLTPEFRDKPIIGVYWEDGTFTVIDGNHRYARAYRDGLERISCNIFIFPFWKQFVLHNSTDESEKEKLLEFVKTGHSGVL